MNLPAASFLKSRIRRLGGRPEGLRHVYMETHGVCSNRCFMCPARAGAKRRPRMDAALFEAVVRELGERGFDGELHLYGHNEPLLDPRIFAFIRQARELAPNARIILISNFTRLRPEDVRNLLESPLSRLTISLYAADAAGYRRVCGTGHFDRVLDNARRFALAWSERRPFPFSVSILQSGSPAETEAAGRLLETFPASWWSMPPVYSLRRTAGAASPTCLRFGACLFDTVKITGDGAVTPCPVDPDAELAIGHAVRDGVYASLDGDRARALRRELFLSSGMSRPAFCRHCDFARDHKLLYFLLPDGVRGRLLDRIDPRRRAAARLPRHFNSREETDRKAEALGLELEGRARQGRKG